MPDGEWAEGHWRDEYVSDAGIIGYRGGDAQGKTWYHHMTAFEIQELVGREVWEQYYKFTVVRNPLDKVISTFFHLRKKKIHPLLRFLPRRLHGRFERKKQKMNPTEREAEIQEFRAWVKDGGIPDWAVDRDKYLINGSLAVDYFIKYENLNEDVKHVCDKLSVPFNSSRIPQFKRGLRHHAIPISEYYDKETAMAVKQLFAWEFEHLGYSLP